MIDWLTHINLIFKISRLQVVQQSGLVQEHELTCWGQEVRDLPLETPIISPFNSVNPFSIILQLHLICSTLNWMSVEYSRPPSLCAHRSTSRQTDNKEGVVAHTAVVVHNLIVGGVAHPTTIHHIHLQLSSWSWAPSQAGNMSSTEQIRFGSLDCSGCTSNSLALPISDIRPFM